MYVNFWIVIFLSNYRLVYGGGKTKKKIEGHDVITVYKGHKEFHIPLDESCLYAHNYLRKQHGVKKLTWNAKLAAAAEKWALVLAKKGKLAHSKIKNYGENVGYVKVSLTPVGLGPAFTIYQWWEECFKPGFNFKDPESERNRYAGHFSQVVWAGTKEVGCGHATRVSKGMENIYLVCQYYPQGNIRTQFKANVAPFKGKKHPESAHQIAAEGCKDYSYKCSAVPQHHCGLSKVIYETCCYSCRRKKN